jgi:glucose-6-phosphate 1-dehydrogenase
MTMNQPCIPTTIVIFGATGDLTWRKLIPALYNNHKDGRLSECAYIIGFARRPMDDESFRKHLLDGVKTFCMDSFEMSAWETFAEKIHYFQGNLDVPADFIRLDSFLKLLEKNSLANRLYYLATAPEHFSTTVTSLGVANMGKQYIDSAGSRRIIVEKPFGHDLASARELNDTLHTVFEESQIYRIDHYLGKETAQNILFFRFANTIFEPVWNRRYIDNVQITVSETVDVGHRAGYYDFAGVLRDMFQNHLFQLLTLVAMESPSSFNSDSVRNEKAKVLESIRPIAIQDTVRGQYIGYHDAEGVAPDSKTPTFAALKLYIDNWRWKGVPFYLRSGKALAQKVSEIIIEFQRPPHLMFRLKDESSFTPNILSLCIQPDEGIYLRFEAKVPNSEQEMRSVGMDFHYQTFFGSRLPEAYERLLPEAIAGDASLFTRCDSIEASWKILDPIIENWQGEGAPLLAEYPPGSEGPPESDALLKREGKIWRLGCMGQQTNDSSED